jgi:hypothetical protein
MFTAQESFESIRSAVDLWEKKFRVGAQIFPAMGGEVIWHENVGTWGHFSRFQPAKRTGHYWNPFGRLPRSFRQNMTVEINPSKAGINHNVQGAIALAPDGARWVLHQGRLHPGKVRISEDMFDRATKRKRARIRFSNGEVVGFHVVANLESPPREVQQQIASFVGECEKVRQYYVAGAEVAEEEERVAMAEGPSSPELSGSYVRRPQGEKLVVKFHADVWQALARELDTLGIAHSNGRVGKYGPDLRTVKRPRILFELKTESTTSDLQRAVGSCCCTNVCSGRSIPKCWCCQIAWLMHWIVQLKNWG